MLSSSKTLWPSGRRRWLKLSARMGPNQLVLQCWGVPIHAGTVPAECPHGSGPMRLRALSACVGLNPLVLQYWWVPTHAGTVPASFAHGFIENDRELN